MAGSAPVHRNSEQQGVVFTAEQLLPLLAINITFQVNEWELTSKSVIMLAEEDCTLRDVAGNSIYKVRFKRYQFYGNQASSHPRIAVEVRVIDLMILCP